jgi:16S rRNA (guanine527-N7)-methyltransferase
MGPISSDRLSTPYDPRLERWLGALVSTPGLTAILSVEEARRVHVDDALSALDYVDAGPVVDVGSGGGSPGLPLAAARPELEFDLLEATRRKCDFLVEAARDFPNVAVVCARAEEWGRAGGRDRYAVAVARAVAGQATTVEWCLPLVRPGGRLVLYTGRPADGLDRVAAELGAGAPEAIAVPGSEARTLLLFEKLEPTPERFPRRVGVAAKRPLGT